MLNQIFNNVSSNNKGTLCEILSLDIHLKYTLFKTSQNINKKLNAKNYAKIISTCSFCHDKLMFY